MTPDARRSLTSDPLTRLRRVRTAVEHLVEEGIGPHRTRFVESDDVRLIRGELDLTIEDLVRQTAPRAPVAEDLDDRRRYQELFDAAPVGYLETDRQGVIQVANRAAAELVGVTPGWMRGRPLARFVRAADRKAFRRHIGIAAEGRALRGVRAQIQPRRLDPILVCFDVAPASDRRDGPPSALRWLVRAVTENLDDHGGTREHEARSRLLLEQVPALTWTTDADLTLTTFEASRSFVHPRLLPHVGNSVAEAFDRDEVMLAGHRHAMATGRATFEAEIAGRSLRCTVEAVRNDDGASTGCIGVATDMSARRADDLDRAARAARLRVLLEQVPALLWTTDTALTITAVQASEGEMIPADPSAEVGGRARRVLPFHPDLPPDDTHRRALEGERVRAFTRWGSRWFDVHVQPLTGPGGVTIGCLGAAIDVTSERVTTTALHRALTSERIASEELHRMIAMKDLLLTTVSHDIINGLTVVIGFSDLLADMPTIDSAKARHMLHNIGVRGRRLERILGDLLHLDRLERQISNPTWDSVDVRALIRRCVAAMNGTDHPIECDAGSLKARVRPAEMERIVENLLDDALKHTPPGTRVWVHTEPAQNEGVLLIVADAGPGIPDALKPAVFDPFRRGTTPAAVGHGVGLSIVSRFAELHGGSAWVEDREGGGTAFHVLLPGPRRENRA